MKFHGAHVLVLVPFACGLIIVNCVSWVLVRLHTGGLPVLQGVGWPWCFYTYAVNRVGPSEFIFTALLGDIGVALGILLAAAVLIALLARKNQTAGWNA